MDRDSVRAFVETTGFRVFIFFVVFINVTVIGVQISVEPRLTESTGWLLAFFQLVDVICVVIYVIEAIMKIFAYHLNYFKSGWNVFDFIIVILAVVPMFFSYVLPLQILRVVSLARVVRVLRVITLFNQMHVIVGAIGRALVGVLWSALLLFIVVYIYDVIGVVTFGEEFPNLFGNLLLGAITLFEAAFTGWPSFAHEVGVSHPAGYAFFFSYTVFSTLIILNVVVGIIVEAIQSSAQAARNEAARGLTPVREKGHILILGFNPATLAILGELIGANANHKTEQPVVILDDRDKTEMENEIYEEYGTVLETATTKVICRTGPIYDVGALERCGIENSKSVIVNPDNDIDMIRGILACTQAMQKVGSGCTSYSIAAVLDPHNAAAAKIAGRDDAGKDHLVLIPMHAVASRILANSCRQPGLSLVYTELIGIEGNEFYLVDRDPCFPKLYGKTIADINLRLDNSIAVGVFHDGTVLIDDPRSVRFSEGDSLILLMEDDEAICLAENPVRPLELAAVGEVAEELTRVLVLGDQPIFQYLLQDFSHYLTPGSQVILADDALFVPKQKRDRAEELLSKRDISFSTRDVNIYNRETLFSLLDETEPSKVVILSNTDTDQPEQEDMRIMQVELFLRDYRERTGHDFGIVCQIYSVKSRKLVDITGEDDFITGKHFGALLNAQIALNRDMGQLGSVILSSEGHGVCMRRAVRYVPTGVDMDLDSVSAAVAKQGDILLGIRQKQDGRFRKPILNPPKHFDDGSSRMYRFSEEDSFAVLSEHTGFDA